jgi:alpha-L-fucosidase
MALVVCVFTYAQGNIHERSSKYEWPADSAVMNKLRLWQDQKFGVLLHWGLYAVPGIVESWSICDEDWITRDTTMTYQQYKDWYWGLANVFRPVDFDPEQWARVVQDAGMKYMIFTTKHHDGFCLWDSRQTDFTIARHAFASDSRRDVLRHVLAAFRSRDFMIGTYFSKPDWHSQYYWWDVFPTKGRNVNYAVSRYPWRWQQFKDFTYRQIEEILSGYGSVDILWLDGGWVWPGNRGQDIDMPHIAQMARRHQPGLLIVDRTIHGPYENYQTPERAVPEVQLPYPWESCIPLSDDWGWVPRPRWKTPQHVINTLIEVVAKGGNLVLGVGPTAEGVLQPEVVERLQAIGRWLRTYGAAIYSTVPVPDYHFPLTPSEASSSEKTSGDLWFTGSKDGRTRYALLALPDGQSLPAELHWQGNLPRRGTAVRIVGSGRKLKWKQQADNTVVVHLPKGLPQESLALEFIPQ